MQKILIILAISVSSISFGQQLPQFSQYSRNHQLVNPGATGIKNYIDVTLGGRLQWIGFENAPKTTYLFGSSEITKKAKEKYNPSLRVSEDITVNTKDNKSKLKHAIGGLFIADQYGAYRQLKIAGTYSLHIPLTNEINLSVGTSLGLSNRAFLQDKAQTLDVLTFSGPIDQTYLNYSQQSNQNTLDLGLGLYLYSKEFFVGFSIDQLTKDIIHFGNGFANYDPRMHFNTILGYKFKVAKNLTFMPTLMVKHIKSSPLSMEFSAQLEYKEAMWFGISYRSTDAIVLMAGANISKKIKFGYSFDYSVSKFNSYSSFGHELVLGIMFGKKSTK